MCRKYQVGHLRGFPALAASHNAEQLGSLVRRVVDVALQTALKMRFWPSCENDVTYAVVDGVFDRFCPWRAGTEREVAQ